MPYQVRINISLALPNLGKWRCSNPSPSWEKSGSGQSAVQSNGAHSNHDLSTIADAPYGMDVATRMSFLRTDQVVVIVVTNLKFFP